MTDVAVDTLRLRGPAAQRLARVAATVLPHALERALSGLGDVAVGRLVVALDVADHDDETLAVLWADAIRAGVLAAVPAASSPPEGQEGARRSTAVPVRPRPDPVAAAREWSARPEPERRCLPAALLALGDPRTAAAVQGRLSSAQWARLLRRLAGALGLPPLPPGSGEAGAPAAARLGPGRAPEPPGGSSGAPGPPSGTGARPTAPTAPTGAPAGPVPPASTGSEPEREDIGRLAVLAELVDENDGDLPLEGLTRAAGLVLLYPWLGEHCRRAEELHPGLDPLDVREAALGAVVAPEDPAAADDPLVRLLAGRPDPRGPVRRIRVPLPALPEVTASAETVLASFAALLPGFGRSSASFVRRSWIVRSGVLDTQREPALLTAATHPLDVVLPLLPYPVTLLKLPWSPPLTVRFR